jgi:hypothetical protein
MNHYFHTTSAHVLENSWALKSYLVLYPSYFPNFSTLEVSNSKQKEIHFRMEKTREIFVPRNINSHSKMMWMERMITFCVQIALKQDVSRTNRRRFLWKNGSRKSSSWIKRSEEKHQKINTISIFGFKSYWVDTFNYLHNFQR